MTLPTVHADFRADLRTHLVTLLAAEQQAVPHEADAHQASILYFNLKWRQVEPRPRMTLWSNELRGRTLSIELRAGLQRLVSASERGDALKPFMSRSVDKASYDDLMFNDWGVHHFHMGSDEAAGFVSRTDELVFAWVTKRSLHLIDVLHHGVWAEDRLLEIVHQNWPHIIAPARARGVVPGSLQCEWSGRTRQKGRKLFLLPWQAADGTIYLPPGGGSALGGLSTWVADRAQGLMRYVNDLERDCRTQAPMLRKELDIEHLPALHFRLEFEPDRWYVRETQCDKLVGLPPLPRWAAFSV